MFKPVKLTRVTIEVPETHISAIMAVLGDLRLLHLIRVEETDLGHLGYVAHVDSTLLARYETLLGRVNSLAKDLPPQGASRDPLRSAIKAPRPDQAIFPLEEACAAIEKDALASLQQRADLHRKITEQQSIIARLRLLAPADLDLGRLHALRYVTWHAGLVPDENLERLEMSLGEIHHSLIPLAHMEQRTVLLAMALKDDEELLTRALKSSFWEPLDLAGNLDGTAADVLGDLEAKDRQIKEDLVGLEKRRMELADKYGVKLQQLREKILLAIQLLRAQEKFGQIDHCYLLTGWLPLALFEDLRKRILEAGSDQAIVERIDPEEVKQVRSGILSIPILFNNPVLIRPFERLTTLYGTPAYDELEPTAFLAVTFLLLFGLMFGDVGHGLVLCCLGYLIFKKMYRYLDYGIILMECGVSAMLFGVLYGSVFGLEHLIPALWMHPMDNIFYFMKVSAVVGFAIISICLIFNLYNTIRQHRYPDLLSASGLPGALFYWLAAALAVRYYLAGTLSSHEVLFAKVTGGLLFSLMVLQRPIRIVISRLRHGEKARQLPAGLGTTLLESCIEVLDELLRYLANTVSFVRIAAFALAHAGLFVAVFTLADMVRNTEGGGLTYWITLLLGNALIIGLEGLVISIQTIRLEYYESFSKFFRGGGTLFQPLIEKKE